MFIKIIATVIILLIIVMGFLITNPAVGSYFENIFDRFSGIAVFEIDTTQRDVIFSLDVDRYDDISVKTRRKIDITAEPDDMSMSLKDGSIKPDKSYIIYGFRGQMEIKGNELNLDGAYDKFEYSDGSTAFGSSDIKAGGTFTNLKVDNFALNDMNLKNVSGKITANEIETVFSGVGINIKYPLGTFVFNSGLRIDGTANKISIPSRGLVIG